MEGKLKLSIVIPVFNEGVNLKMLLPILEAVVETPHETLIVHDIPNDDSIPVVKSLQKKYTSLKLVHNTLGRGVINAVKSGVNVAMGDYVLIIAADDIGPSLIINEMIYLMGKGCDLVNATRYAYGGKNIGGVFMSRTLSIIANRLFQVLAGCALTDPTLGVKMFRRSLFRNIKLESKPVGWAVSFEFAMKAQAAGWKLGEVPLVSLNRIYGGKSSFKLGPWVAEYTRWFLWGLRNLRSANNKKKVLVKMPSNMQ